jgi:ABC-type transport system involved in multi-copper enzyme maturation permease subunit
VIRQILRRELLKNFQSFRFFALFAVAVFLFTINPFLVATEYRERVQKYSENVEKMRKWDKNHGIGTFRRPNPMSFVAGSSDGNAPTGYSVILSLGVSPLGVDQYGVNVTFPSFQLVDWVFILKVLFSLFAILLTFDAVSGEKERGTLALICSNSVSRASIVMGKYLGALITAIIPAAVGMLISMIIVNIQGNTSLDADSMFRLAVIAIMALAYISLFSLIGLAVSSAVHRSSVSLLLSLSVWIILIIVIPNLAGIIAESALEVTSEYEFARREQETYRAIGKWERSVAERGLTDESEISRDFGRSLTQQAEQRIRLKDSYVNTIYQKEDLAINISRISPASEFEFASAAIIDGGVLAQRRFYRASRQYYDLYADYVLEKTGMVAKYYQFMTLPVVVKGKRIIVGPPKAKPLPEDTSDFPAMPKANLSVSESIASGIWNIALLVIWNVALFMLSYMTFLKYDVRG